MNSTWFKWFFVLSIAIGAALVSLGFYEIQGQQHIQNLIALHNCNDIKVIASIAKETVKHAASPEAQKILAKISFPGLSHHELVKLVHENLAREKHNLHRLEIVRRASCE